MIIHCHSFISSHNANIAFFERALGFDSRFIALTPHPFGLEADEVACTSKNLIKIELSRWKLFFKVLFLAKEVHFIGGASLMPKRYSLKLLKKKLPLGLRCIYFLYSLIFEMLDVRIFALMKKRQIFTFLGSDARFESYSSDALLRKIVSDYCDDKKRKKHRITVINKYADKIYYVNPDLYFFLPKRASFVPYVFKSLSAKSRGLSSKKNKKKIVIAHIPSNRKIKGSDFVLDAIKALEDEGLEFEFLLLENTPHEKLKQAIEDIDLLIDQLIVGWYGFISLEFLSRGKDVMCYLELSESYSYQAKAMLDDCPIINVDRVTITQKIREYILNFSTKNKLTRAEVNKNYVKKWHNGKEITKKVRNNL